MAPSECRCILRLDNGGLIGPSDALGIDNGVPKMVSPNPDPVDPRLSTTANEILIV